MKSDTDSDDELPSYGFKYVPSEENSNNVDKMLIIDKIIASRKKKEIFFEKIAETNVLSSENSNAGEDDDIRFIFEKAEELDVDYPVQQKLQRVIMNPERSLMMFNHKSLNVQQYVPSLKLKYDPEEFCGIFGMTSIYYEAFSAMVYSEQEKKEFFTFMFFLMTVHPDILEAGECLNTLCTEEHFHPELSDFIQVFQNWGVELHNLYATVPPTLLDVSNKITVINPNTCTDVQDHNLEFVFKYLYSVLTRPVVKSYFDMIEPLIRLIFDVRIFQVTHVYGILVDVVNLLIDQMIEINGNCWAVQHIHIRNLSLEQQTYLCTQVVHPSRAAILLGYVTLQQFVGCSEVMYCEFVDLETVYSLLEDASNIKTSSHLDVYCYIQIVRRFLANVGYFDRSDAQLIRYEQWYDLIRNWPVHCVTSHASVFVQKAILEVQFQLQRLHLRQQQQQHEIKLQKKVLEKHSNVN